MADFIGTKHSKPNILITGTPGTGKSSFAQMAAERLPGYKLIDVNSIIKENECHEGMDVEFDSLIVDDDKLLDIMEDLLVDGGCVVDYHSCDFFPERWFDLVIVLLTNTEILYDRLVARGYSKKKIDENMECEIMQVVSESAKESYAPEIVVELPSNVVEDIEGNMARLESWYATWMAQHPSDNA